MDLYIECPVCEQQFSTPTVRPEQIIVCPSCSRKFPLSSATEVSPPDEQDIAPPKYSSRLEVPSAFDNSDEGLDDEIPVAKSVAASKPVTKKPILALQRKRRNRRRLITTLISSAILATIIGVLAGLLYQQLKDKPILNDGTSGTVLAKVNDNHDVPNDQPDSSVTGNDPEEVKKQEPDPDIDPDKKPIPPEDIPPQTFEYLDPRSAKDRWNAVQPHLVSLKVFDGLGTHEAVGTIVDSRGWILTSYNAVKGASKIEVTASVNSIDDYWEAKPLTDLVRGYIAEKKENDLVLLSINRRFVVAFSIVQPAVKNNVVASEYLLQCAPPSRANLYGGTETKIATRSNIEGLPSAGQSLARRNRLDAQDLTWLVASGKTLPQPGTPLFKLESNRFETWESRRRIKVRLLSPLRTTCMSRAFG